ncbi:Peptidase family M1 [Filimonas lacunae]|uniref:Peptidase family M1 n=1 Tax=Filimonas lacunae TaxID=477680 RepID=A0A173MKR7_9BACT|nr:M1 family metallopeptidase [Filimonas lacunae]BAV08080.1 peptidase, M1 family [Filimonas lacunae]SIT08998.1 Peptidase family M1 [Filimonas lacunae]
MKQAFFVLFLAMSGFSQAQLMTNKPVATHADSLRGSMNPERSWWDVLRYDITVIPDIATKTISGSNVIRYKVTTDSYPAFMQIDLQEPMDIDSVLFDAHRALRFTREGNAWHVQVPKQKKDSEGNITVYFHGQPREAIRPPWDGGWIWTKDEQNRAWVSAACQGLGASVWYPCKDHQSDEPDNGASLSITVPDTMVAVANGRLQSKTQQNGYTQWKWQVINPINNYNLIPYIGKYENYTDTMQGGKGVLDISYWALDYDIPKAKQQFTQVKQMLRAFEYWFGPYPFYEDGYKIIEAPHLGMEHQTAVAYGNHFKNGYLGRDLSGTGWGMKWDFIIVHESGHEWFANNITSRDIADMWIHESFTNYSETLFTEYFYGKEAGSDYCYGTRAKILNDKPIIGPYGVNQEGSGDMYYKGGNMLHTIRHIINNDSLFRQILIGLNTTYYHQTVTTQQIEYYISKHAGINLGKVFDQYLRTIQIPELQYSVRGNQFYFRWNNCIKGFDMPLPLTKGGKIITLRPGISWQHVTVNKNDKELFDPAFINRQFYITLKKTNM